MMGVTSFIDTFHEPVNWNKKAKEKAKKKGVSQEEILKQWEDKKEQGKRVHLKIQERTQGKNVFSATRRNGESSDSLVPDAKLVDGMTYLERPVYSLRHSLIGYPDRVDVIKNTIHIEDYKTWDKVYYSAKSIRTDSGWSKPKMFSPIQDLDDCPYIHAILQLSLYMHILWENNRNLKVGKLYIRHVTTNSNDHITSEEMIEVPYLREEVRAMLKFKKANQL